MRLVVVVLLDVAHQKLARVPVVRELDLVEVLVDVDGCQLDVPVADRLLVQLREALVQMVNQLLDLLFSEFSVLGHCAQLLVPRVEGHHHAQSLVVHLDLQHAYYAGLLDVQAEVEWLAELLSDEVVHKLLLKTELLDYVFIGGVLLLVLPDQ